MAPSLTTILGLAAAVAAPALAQTSINSVVQSRVITMTVPVSVQGGTILASVISVVDTSTAFAIKCAASQCPDLASATLNHGPSTMALAFSKTRGSSTIGYSTAKCKVVQENIAECQSTAIEGAKTTSGQLAGGVPSSWIQAVTITAGVEKLAAQSSSPSGVELTPIAPPTPTPTGASNGTAPEPVSSSSKTGAAPIQTARAMAAAGVMAVVGGAMLV